MDGQKEMKKLHPDTSLNDSGRGSESRDTFDEKSYPYFDFEYEHYINEYDEGIGEYDEILYPEVESDEDCADGKELRDIDCKIEREQTTKHMRKAWGRIKRARLLVRLCILAAVTFVVSLACIVVDIIVIQKFGPEFRFKLSGALFGGGMALLFSCCSFCLYYVGKKELKAPGLAKLFNCCLIVLVIWFCVTIFVLLLSIAFAAIFGLRECTGSEEWTKYSDICGEDVNVRNALVIAEIALITILTILTVALFLTICCYPQAFGCKSLYERGMKTRLKLVRDNLEMEITRLNIQAYRIQCMAEDAKEREEMEMAKYNENNNVCTKLTASLMPECKAEDAKEVELNTMGNCNDNNNVSLKLTEELMGQCTSQDAKETGVNAMANCNENNNISTKLTAPLMPV